MGVPGTVTPFLHINLFMSCFGVNLRILELSLKMNYLLSVNNYEFSVKIQ